MDIIWATIFMVMMAFVIVGLGRGLIEHKARAIRNPEMEAKAESAGHRVATDQLGGPEVSGTLHGTPFVMRAIPGANTTPSVTMVTVPSELGTNFAISREESRDLSGRDLVQSMFPDLRAREAVRALFGLGFDTVTQSGRNLSAIMTLKAEVLHPDTLSAAVGQLALIRATTGVHAEPTWMFPTRSSILIVLVSLALMVAGMFLFSLGSAHGTAAIRHAWPGIAAAYLTLAALAVFFLRGRPLAGGEIASVVILGLPGLFLVGCGLAMLAG